jgi:hypothetical protein
MKQKLCRTNSESLVKEQVRLEADGALFRSTTVKVGMTA